MNSIHGNPEEDLFKIALLKKDFSKNVSEHKSQLRRLLLEKLQEQRLTEEDLLYVAAGVKVEQKDDLNT